MTLRDAKAYLLDGIYPEGKTSNGQILKEIEYLRSCRKLLPKVYLAYDRFAYSEKDCGEKGMRITFDYNVRARRTHLSLDEETYGTNLLEPGMCLMEIKVADSIPLWLNHFLTREKIFSTSFSKYGKEYMEHCRAEWERKKSGIRNENEEVKENVYINFGNSRNRECVNG